MSWQQNSNHSISKFQACGERDRWTQSTHEHTFVWSPVYASNWVRCISNETGKEVSRVNIDYVSTIVWENPI